MSNQNVIEFNGETGVAQITMETEMGVWKVTFDHVHDSRGEYRFSYDYKVVAKFRNSEFAHDLTAVFREAVDNPGEKIHFQ